MSDTQCRKWQITINNPLDKGFTHTKITEELQSLKSLVYYCMADESGQTHHTHIFCAFSSAVRFSTLKARFPEAHLEAARGSVAQNRDYIAKTGKWENDRKHGTCIPGTFEEWGDIPEERQGRRTDLDDLYQMVKEGATDLEILEVHPRAMMYLDIIGDTTATSSYQPSSFVCGDHIVVCRANWMNVYTALFVVSLLQAERYRYSYGRAFKMQLISETIIKLPSTEEGCPDWTWVENFVRSLPYGDRI